MKGRHLACVTATLFLCDGAALAHHSFNMFDQNKTIKLAGAVKEFEWANPHAWLYIDAVGPDGKVAMWSLEMGGPIQIARGGWRRDTVKVGDKVVVEMHPLKDGTRGGQFLAATLPDGRTLGQVDNGIRLMPAPGGDEETLRQGTPVQPALGR